jgi:Tfp pilus assembly protein PilF
MDGDFKYEDMFFEADQLIGDGLIGKAMELLSDIINEQPDFGRAHNHLGWIYETKLRKYKEAEEHYRAALAYSPEYPAVYRNYAILLSTMKKYNDLETLLAKALTVAGVDHAAVHNEYAIMYELQSKFDLAIEFYKKAILASLSEKDIELYQASVRRCENKKTLV